METMIKGAPYQCFGTDTIYKGHLNEKEHSSYSRIAPDCGISL
jgi:hypothetical protein